MASEVRRFTLIDLKKPLEGVPGVLLLVALIFFGATIGIAVAIVFTWIPMSDALANFLGGVFGAGLGAALAVMGAVYVQRRDRRDRLTVPLNQMWERIGTLAVKLKMLRDSLERPWVPPESGGDDDGPMGMYSTLREVQALASGFPDFYELPGEIRGGYTWVKLTVPMHVDLITRAVYEKRERTEEQKRRRALDWTDMATKTLEDFIERSKRLSL